jgi:superfamily II DNA/RNA helicase
MATATMSKAVRRLLDSEFDPDLSEAKNLKLPNPNRLPPDFQTSGSTGANKQDRIPLKILEVSGLHRSLPTVKHDMIDAKGADKLEILLELVTGQRKEQTIIFCNTVPSSSAVEHALKNHGISSTLYNGEMNSKAREASLEAFRNGEVRYLVCTDIASRGLDIPDVKHVIMFDFPRNPIDYLHRAGRTGRAGAEGKVTSILQKRDLVLGEAIKAAIQKGLPLDNLSANKLDYAPDGKLSSVRKLSSLGRNPKTTAQPTSRLRAGRASRKELKGKPGSLSNPLPPGSTTARRSRSRRAR